MRSEIDGAGQIRRRGWSHPGPSARIYDPLEMVTSFKYLGWVVSAADNDWLAVVRNLAKAWAVCQRLTRILRREGVTPRVSGFSFKAVVQSVLIFGAETWAVIPHIGRVPGGVPGLGGMTIEREAPAATDIQKMGIHLVGGGKRGGMIQGNGKIH